MLRVQCTQTWEQGPPLVPAEMINVNILYTISCFCFFAAKPLRFLFPAEQFSVLLQSFVSEKTIGPRKIKIYKENRAENKPLTDTKCGSTFI